MDSDLESLKLGSTPLSPLNQKGLWFGIAGLYQSESMVLWGSQKPALNKGLEFWKSPEVRFFIHPLSVKKQSLKRSNPLRIPAQVWNELTRQPDEIKLAERRKARDIFDTPKDHWSFQCPQVPVDNIITSKFGSPRTLPSGRSYFHSGVDLRARTGTPIKATSRGLVRFAGPMTVPGNNVILDHGQGLFSRYMHLSEVKVKAGEWVEAGDVLGLAGASGRVEAPHLHWEMIWKGQYANPLALLQTWGPLCDQG